jgi:hypothetical protein
MMKVVLLEMACFGINLGLSWMRLFSKTVLEQMLPSVKNVIAMCS